MLGLVLILLCVEGFLLRKIWSKDHRLAKIVTKSEFVDPRKEDEHPIEKSQTEGKELAKLDALTKDPSQLTKREYELLQVLMQQNDTIDHSSNETLIPETENNAREEDYNPTCLLNDTGNLREDSPRMILETKNEDLYSSIPITEFPFFIGKLRKNVDYCIEKNVVSRYHAKITKEEDRIYITDLNSTNGTYVNEEILQTYEKCEIKHGDRIALANLQYEFKLS